MYVCASVKGVYAVGIERARAYTCVGASILPLHLGAPGCTRREASIAILNQASQEPKAAGSLAFLLPRLSASVSTSAAATAVVMLVCKRGGGRF